MSKQGMRTFAAGILCSCLVIYLYTHFIEKPSDQSQLTINEKTSMEKKLAEKDKTINQLQDKVKKLTSTSKIEAEKQSSESHQQPYHYVLTINQGMTPNEVAGLLEEAKIISSSNDFSNLITDQHASNAIQIGTYDLDSEMSYQEIINLITQ